MLPHNSMSEANTVTVTNYYPILRFSANENPIKIAQKVIIMLNYFIHWQNDVSTNANDNQIGYSCLDSLGIEISRNNPKQD